MEPKVSIVVAHRVHADPWRQQCAEWTFARAREMWPDYELVIGDAHDEVFNHAAAFNEGAARALGDVLVLTDSDTTVNRHTMGVAVSSVSHWAAPWCMAAEYLKLTRGCSEALLECDPESAIMVDSSYPPELVEWAGSTSWAGFVVMRASDFRAIGGYDARLSGWAPDDIAFGLTASALIGDPVRVPGSVFHLWHEPAFEAEHGWTDEKRDLKDAYIAAAGNERRMRTVMRGKPGWDCTCPSRTVSSDPCDLDPNPYCAFGHHAPLRFP